MDRDDLKTQVQEMVASFWTQKEEAEIRKSTEKALEESASTISELTSSLETKTEEVASLEEKLSESESAKEELESQLEAANKKLTETDEELASTKQALENMKKDRAAESRMAELEDAGVASSDKDSQMAKIREMSNEDFASYKEELVSVRNAVIAELDKAKATADAKAEEEAKKAAEEAKGKPPVMDEEDEDMKNKKKAKKKAKCSTESEEGSSEEEGSEESASEEEDTPAPAEISPGQAVAAALNFESVPSKDIIAKYKSLGEALAKRFKKSE